MQEKIQLQASNTENNFFLPEILSLQEQKQRLKCPNHNQATSVCISSQCLLPGLMCLQSKCQCRKIHYKCHHILIDRVLESVIKHQKEIPQKVKETYKTIYQEINQIIEKLSNLRTKFQKEEQYFGLRQEELQLMDIIYDKKIDKINGKVISSLQKTFDIEIQLNQNTKQLIIKDFEQNKKQFDKMYSSIKEKYLQIKNQSQKKLTKNLFCDSYIVKSQQQIELLKKWLIEQSINPQTQINSQLIFRASQHDYRVKKFHELCDNKKNLLVIIKNQFEKIIGGFTPNEWDKSFIYNTIEDKTKKSFLFSLNLQQKYICTDLKTSLSYSPNYGPRFGKSGDADLVIDELSNVGSGSYGNLGSSYNLINNNQAKYKQKTQQTYTLWTGNPNGNTFKVKQYEVYKINGIKI